MMNKTEAKEKLHKLAFAKMNNKPDDLELADVVRIVDKINEPEKVSVPSYIADKIDFCKRVAGLGLYHSMDYCYQYENSANWLEHNEELFVQAWLDGYQVEKQKYIVEIPNPETEGQKRFFLGHNGNGKVVIVQRKKVRNFSPLSLTEDEIKRSHAWAWGAGFAKPAEEVKQ